MVKQTTDQAAQSMLLNEDLLEPLRSSSDGALPAPGSPQLASSPSQRPPSPEARPALTSQQSFPSFS